MRSDPMKRVRRGRPPLTQWTASRAGRDRWESTQRRGLEGTFPSIPRPSPGPAQRSRRLRWAGLFAAAALLVSGTAAATAAITRPATSRDHRAELPVIGLRTSPTGWSLVIDVIASPCLQAHPRARATETPTTVTVSVIYDPVTSAHAGPGCPDVPLFTALTVPLRRALGSRAVSDDVTARTLHPFDGATLLNPTWLPPGYRLSSDAPDGDGWYRTWTIPTPAYYIGPGTAPCTSRSPDIGIGQSPAPAGVGRFPFPLHARVGNVPATLSRTTRSTTILAWSPPHLPAGQSMVVASTLPCSNRTYLPISTLLRIARGLR